MLQNFSPVRMMRALLEGAVNWVRAGLPMKRMQIVIYQKNPSKTRHTNKKNEVVELFEKFRSKIEKSQRQKEVNIWSAILTLSFHELLINCSIH